ncbi:unnamed protein product, partial [Musa acuminata subsp. burmannicoides]
YIILYIYYLFVAVLLAEDDLGVEAEAVDLADADEVGALEEAEEAVDAPEEVVGRVFVAAPVHRDVEHRYPARPQSPLHLRREPLRVQRVVEHVGELEVEGVVREWLRVEVAGHHQGRRRRQVHPHGTDHADTPQGRHLLPHPCSDAERRGCVGDEALHGQVGEEAGEDAHLAVPVAGRPQAPEPRVEGLVQLPLDVVVVGAEARAHADGGGGGGDGGGPGRAGCGGEEEMQEEEEGEEEEEDEGLVGNGHGEGTELFRRGYYGQQGFEKNGESQTTPSSPQVLYLIDL